MTLQLTQQYEDIETMIEMGYEENDPELVPEIDQMLQEFIQTYEAIRMKTLLSGEYDANNAILSLHAGAGGTESCDWAAMLFRMYSRWADKKGFSLEVLDSLDGDEAGIKSITFQVNGRSQHMNKDKAMQMLKAKLYLLKQEENAAKAAGIRGEVTEIGWGNQIRSYVMQPYTMVKDHRTGVESGNVDAVMDGGLDPFINGYLKWLSLGCPKSMEDENE